MRLIFLLIVLIQMVCNGQSIPRSLGNKSYEVSNHLGNIMTVVSDRKTPIQETTTNMVAFNETNIKSFNDYYPYGILLENRNGSINYRFGFQGQEKDDEIKGQNHSINYKYRVHDPRLGRFFAVDPLSQKYPYYSSYQFSGNRLIDAKELEGLEPKVINGVLKGYYVQKDQGFTHIVNDINNPETQKEYGYTLNKTMSWISIMEQNQDQMKLENYNNIYDSKDKGYTHMDMNEGEELRIAEYFIKTQVNDLIIQADRIALQKRNELEEEQEIKNSNYVGGTDNGESRFGIVGQWMTRKVEAGLYSTNEYNAGAYVVGTKQYSFLKLPSPKYKLAFQYTYKQKSSTESKKSNLEPYVNIGLSWSVFGVKFNPYSGDFSISIGPQSPGMSVDVGAKESNIKKSDVIDISH